MKCLAHVAKREWIKSIKNKNKMYGIVHSGSKGGIIIRNDELKRIVLFHNTCGINIVKSRIYFDILIKLAYCQTCSVIFPKHLINRDVENRT